MTIDLAKNKEEFIELAKKYIKRDGIDKVLNWLESTDFYTAPASTQYHLAVEGGLCQHSLNVFHRMVELAQWYFKKYEDVYDTQEGEPEVVFNGESLEEAGSFSMENIAVVALFHDICKANCYVKDFKNVKVEGKWTQQEYWKWDEEFVYGHGTKSVYILQQFMRLYIDEAQAIRFHMGGKEDQLSDSYDRLFAKVYEKSKFAVLLYLADNVAAWMDESV